MQCSLNLSYSQVSLCEQLRSVAFKIRKSRFFEVVCISVHADTIAHVHAVPLRLDVQGRMTNLLNILGVYHYVSCHRRTIYLTIMSALDFEEAGHKLMKIQVGHQLLLICRHFPKLRLLQHIAHFLRDSAI